MNIFMFFWYFWLLHNVSIFQVSSIILTVVNVCSLLCNESGRCIFHVMSKAIFYSDPYNVYCRVKHWAYNLLRHDLKVSPQSSRCSVAYFLFWLICCAGVLKVMANHSGIKCSWQLDWNTLALIAGFSAWPNQWSLHDFNTKHATFIWSNQTGSSN